MWMDGYKKAMKHLLSEREKAPNCKVCNIKLFDYSTCLDEYYYRKGNALRESASDINRIYFEIYNTYPFHKEDNPCKIRHHLNYMYDVTIFVCGNMPFTEVDHVQMKSYVEGWRPDPHRFETYNGR